MKNTIRHYSVREYAIALKRTPKGVYRPAATRTVYAHSFKMAAAKLKVSPAVMRRYGIIVRGKK